MNTLCSNSNHALTACDTQRCEQLAISETSPARGKRSILGAPIRLLTRFGNYVVRKHNERIDRQAFHHLLRLDDSLLKDIGVTRQDIIWASNLPLSVDAAAKIEEIARRR